MYKILIKYVSTSQRVFWEEYSITQEDGTISEFETDDIDLLINEINKLDKIYGYENIRVINDINYAVNFNITTQTGAFEYTSSEDIQNIYSTAYKKVFPQT